jgi:hypothetical protein
VNYLEFKLYWHYGQIVATMPKYDKVIQRRLLGIFTAQNKNAIQWKKSQSGMAIMYVGILRQVVGGAAGEAVELGQILKVAHQSRAPLVGHHPQELALYRTNKCGPKR